MDLWNSIKVTLANSSYGCKTSFCSSLTPLDGPKPRRPSSGFKVRSSELCSSSRPGTPVFHARCLGRSGLFRGRGGCNRSDPSWISCLGTRSWWVSKKIFGTDFGALFLAIGFALEKGWIMTGSGSRTDKSQRVSLKAL